MIRQYLSNTNESAIVLISQKFLELNRCTQQGFVLRLVYSKKFYKMDTVAFSFVFDKYCPIMD